MQTFNSFLLWSVRKDGHDREDPRNARLGGTRGGVQGAGLAKSAIEDGG
jgi:hypothetical protein